MGDLAFSISYGYAVTEGQEGLTADTVKDEEGNPRTDDKGNPLTTRILGNIGDETVHDLIFGVEWAFAPGLVDSTELGWFRQENNQEDDRAWIGVSRLGLAF